MLLCSHCSCVCSLANWRPQHSLSTIGGSTDYLVLGSDSGRISILQYRASTNSFVKVHEETYGKSGCRRIVPGAHVAVDPKVQLCCDTLHSASATACSLSHCDICVLLAVHVRVRVL